MSLKNLKSIFGPGPTSARRTPEKPSINGKQSVPIHPHRKDVLGNINSEPTTGRRTPEKPSATLNKPIFSSLEDLWNTWVPNGTWTVDKYNGRDSLDTKLRGQIYSHTSPPQLTDRKIFVLDTEETDVNNHPFISETFDPRVGSAKLGTFYTNIDKTFNEATDDASITFQTAGIDNAPYESMTELGVGLDRSGGWLALYNANHTPKEGGTFDGFFKPYHYGPNVSRGKLDIRANNAKSGIFSFSRTPLLGAGDFGGALTDFTGEPYMTNDLPLFSSDRPLLSAGNREVPLLRGIDDAIRLTKYLTSPAGVAFALKQNVLGFNTSTLSRSKPPTAGLIDIPATPPGVGDDDILYKTQQRHNTFYSPLSSIGAAGARLFGQGFAEVLGIRKDLGLGDSKYYGGDTVDTIGSDENVNLSFMNTEEQLTDATTNFPIATGIKFRNPDKKSGDKQTNLGFGRFKSEDSGPRRYFQKLSEAHPNDKGIITDTKNGMPFYFKDLRDNALIVFRAYIEGLTENISPSYASTNYMGRSEPVYVYERAERELNFTLKLVAQSPDELEAIYKKMNRLTSLCYPEYTQDDYGKNRMKPPLTKFRLGELFGTTDNEMMGFIKSLSYNVDATSTYSTTNGKRVPKNINATISYQVIHGKVPELHDENGEYKFYGYVGA